MVIEVSTEEGILSQDLKLEQLPQKEKPLRSQKEASVARALEVSEHDKATERQRNVHIETGIVSHAQKEKQSKQK